MYGYADVEESVGLLSCKSPLADIAGDGTPMEEGELLLLGAKVGLVKLW